jgi:hypothetical protein
MLPSVIGGPVTMRLLRFSWALVVHSCGLTGRAPHWRTECSIQTHRFASGNFPIRSKRRADNTRPSDRDELVHQSNLIVVSIAGISFSSAARPRARPHLPRASLRGPLGVPSPALVYQCSNSFDASLLCSPERRPLQLAVDWRNLRVDGLDLRRRTNGWDVSLRCIRRSRIC